MDDTSTQLASDAWLIERPDDRSGVRGHLNSGMVQAGSLLRFRGVVFNDNGSLRLDCNEMLDGVSP